MLVNRKNVYYVKIEAYKEKEGEKQHKVIFCIINEWFDDDHISDLDWCGCSLVKNNGNFFSYMVDISFPRIDETRFKFLREVVKQYMREKEYKQYSLWRLRTYIS